MGKSNAPFKYSPAQQFSKGIKKDIKEFLKLKDSKQWDSWYLATKAPAQIQYISEVFDPKYIPIRQSDKFLFSENNVFVYAAFAEVLITDKGKSLVKCYKLYWDAQKIDEDLL